MYTQWHLPDNIKKGWTSFNCTEVHFSTWLIYYYITANLCKINLSYVSRLVGLSFVYFYHSSMFNNLGSKLAKILKNMNFIIYLIYFTLRKKKLVFIFLLVGLDMWITWKWHLNDMLIIFDFICLICCMNVADNYSLFIKSVYKFVVCLIFSILLLNHPQILWEICLNILI